MYLANPDVNAWEAEMPVFSFCPAPFNKCYPKAVELNFPAYEPEVPAVPLAPVPWFP
jgi:hypothetical protein